MDADLRRKLDRITNILWGGGVTNPVTYIEQISYLIYLKLLDEQESQNEQQRKMTGKSVASLFPLQADRFRWQNWRFKNGDELRNFLRDEVFRYMGSLTKEEPRVAEYFRNAVLEISDPSVLKEVISELDLINFTRLGPDVKGDIFEYLLTHLGQSALNGQFRTPRQIRAFMVAMVDPDFGDTIYDPACGTGGFLIDAVDYILAKYSEESAEVPIYGEQWLEDRGKTIEEIKKEIPNLQIYRKGAGEKIPNWQVLESSIFGIDVSRQIMRIAAMNAVLHGIPKANIKEANTLSSTGRLTDEDLQRKYKVILSNPPFAGQLPTESIRDDIPTKSKKSELLFLAVMMEALAPGGRAAVIVPEGLLFGSTSAHVDLRKKLINDFELLAIVSLPAGVFKPYAGVKTGVLVFRKPTEEGKKARSDKVWFYEIRNDGYDPDKITGGGRPETPDKNDIPELLRQWEEFRRSDFKRPPGADAGTLLPADSEVPRSWWAGIKTIEENNFDFAAGRYKPQIAERAPDDDPVQLLQEALAIERHMVEGLEKLLKDLGAV